MGIRNPFKKKARQDFIILTGFGGAVDDSLNKVEGKGYAANESTKEAWSVDDENMVRDRKTGRLIQLVTAWNTTPVQMFGPKKNAITTANIQALAARVTDEAIVWEQERQHRNTLVFWTGIVCAILALGIVIPVLQAVFTGKMKIPFIGF
jgi:hypothetical protein